MTDVWVKPQHVADRVVCLGVYVFRGRFEGTLGETSWLTRLLGRDEVDGVKSSIEELVEWVRRAELWESLSAAERSAMDLSPGRWPRATIVHAGQQEEALGVLAWALELVPDLHPYDAEYNGRALLSCLPFASDSPDAAHHLGPHEVLTAFRERALLRSPLVLAEQRERAELWVWRVQRSEPGRELEAAVARAVAAGWFEPIEGDFPAFGVSFGRLSRPEAQLVQRIAQARLHALNWLAGRADDWDRVPTDTMRPGSTR